MANIHLLKRLRKWLSFNRLAVLREHYFALKDEARPKDALGRMSKIM
jgi:hypothetical protein